MDHVDRTKTLKKEDDVRVETTGTSTLGNFDNFDHFDNFVNFDIIADSLALPERLYGNDELLRHLINDALSGQLSHAYIVEGPLKSGKKLLVKTVAAVMSDSSQMAKKIFEGISPDILTTAPAEGKKTIGIDDVRAIRRAAYIKPNDLDFKMFVIDGCDRMTVQAQNALLKILEEPPGATYFFLLCESSSALLATVRSRAPTVRMHSFEKKELRDCLIEHFQIARDISTRDPKFFEKLPGNIETIGQAIDAIASIEGKKSGENGGKGVKGEKRDAERDAMSVLENLLKKTSEDIYNAVLSMPRTRDELLVFTAKIRMYLRDMTVSRLAAPDELLFGDPSEIKRIVSRRSTASLLELDAIFEDFESGISQNINIQSALLALAADICRAAGS